MAKGEKAKSINVEALRHKDRRANIPTEELRDFVAEDEAKPKTILYPRDPSIDPQLVWKGKDEQDSKDLEVPAVPVYIQEKIHPKYIIEDLRAQAKEGRPAQLDFFADFNGLQFEELVEFYQHEQNWTNRMILGDSLLVMASLAEKEGLKGKVQMIYIDPPYGIGFDSNWQVSTRNRDIKDGKVEDATRQPEQIKAFRDTWRLGIHSYLAYLRDRLVVARDLLTETGSIFVQIGDENVHLVRCLLDEVFGPKSFISDICFQKIYFRGSDYLDNVFDHIIWYGKDEMHTKFRQIFRILTAEELLVKFNFRDTSDGAYEEIETVQDFEMDKCFLHDNLLSPGSATEPVEIEFGGRLYKPHLGYHWKTTKEGLLRLKYSNRLIAIGNWLKYKRYARDFPIGMINNVWTDTVPSTFGEKKSTLSKLMRRLSNGAYC